MSDDKLDWGNVIRSDDEASLDDEGEEVDVAAAAAAAQPSGKIHFSSGGRGGRGGHGGRGGRGGHGGRGGQHSDGAPRGASSRGRGGGGRGGTHQPALIKDSTLRVEVRSKRTAPSRQKGVCYGHYHDVICRWSAGSCPDLHIGPQYPMRNNSNLCRDGTKCVRALTKQCDLSHTPEELRENHRNEPARLREERDNMRVTADAIIESVKNGSADGYMNLEMAEKLHKDADESGKLADALEAQFKADDLEALTATVSAATVSPVATHPQQCAFYLRGNCKNGPMCQFSHAGDGAGAGTGTDRVAFSRGTFGGRGAFGGGRGRGRGRGRGGTNN